MNNLFSIDRFWLLLKGTIVENKYKDLRLALVMMAVIAFFAEFGIYCFNYSIINFPVVAVAIFIASVSFKRLGDLASGINYLMIPASTVEKTAVNIIYTQLYLFVILTISALIGYYAGQVLHFLTMEDFTNGATLHFAPINFENFGWYLLILTFWQSVAIFGSVYFKKLAIVKTLLTIGAYGMVLIFFWISLAAILSNFVEFDTQLNFNWHITNNGASIVMLIAHIVGILFFWFMTYLRLRETEA